jgi:hypothetical protein
MNRIWKRVLSALRYYHNREIRAQNQVLREEKTRRRRIRNQALLDELYKGAAPKILNGPFSGMRYIKEAYGSALLPKLLGSYEQPIHEWIERVCATSRYKVVIDVGCAEGYYACGFAKRMPSSRVFAYDVNKEAVSAAKRLSRDNELSNIFFGNLFNPQELEIIRGPLKNSQLFIFMDIEGAELDFLRACGNETLSGLDFLIELHDCFRSGITEEIVSLLQKSHQLEIVFDYNWRSLERYKLPIKMEQSDFEEYVDEMRPVGMRWLLAISRKNL